MRQIGIHGFAAIVAIYVLLFAAGCGRPSGEAVETDVEPQKAAVAEVGVEEPQQSVKLALRFVPGDSTTYKVAQETGKSVQWEGAAPGPKGFQGGHTDNKTEMTFLQQIESIEDTGNGIAKITIKALKYQTKIKDNVVLDFDSSRQEDLSAPLGRLIGQSYTIEITPSGEVSKVIDANEAAEAVSADKTAAALLSVDAIKERHSISALPAPGQSQLQTGEGWSNIENVSFDMMGVKSYERIYTLNEIQDANGRRIAVAAMEGVPSVRDANEPQRAQATDLFSRMFDNTEEYTGELRLDLTEGKVAEYREDLRVEWLIVDPNPKQDEPPAALRMAATRFFAIQKID